MILSVCPDVADAVMLQGQDEKASSVEVNLDFQRKTFLWLPFSGVKAGK